MVELKQVCLVLDYSFFIGIFVKWEINWPVKVA